jgi:hypothetical protein
MRTKTMILSTLLGALGSVSVMAQTNVYSLNAVGYINAQIPPGFSILTCPLIASPDNTLNTLLPNTNQVYGGPNGGNPYHTQVYAFANGSYTVTENAISVSANPSGWSAGGLTTINPGQAVFIYNPLTTNETATFVGTVPTGSLTNVLAPGFSLVGSIVPASGDIVTNPIMNYTNAAKQDNVYTFDTNAQVFDIFNFTPGLGGWSSSGVLTNPTTLTPAQGFFYYNNTAFVTATNYWVENYSVAQ